MLNAGPHHLTLHREDKPTVHLPVNRIARILCNHNITWTGQAFMLCLSSGIPVIWMSGHGKALGHTQCRVNGEHNIGSQIELYAELPDWQERFGNWLMRRRLETLDVCAESARKAGHPFTPNELAQLKREFVYKARPPVHIDCTLEAWCHGLAVEFLQKEKLRNLYWGHGGLALDLAESLTALLWAELNIESGSLPDALGENVVLTRFFESWAHTHEHRLHHHLGDFKRHIKRELEEWP